MTKPIVLIDLDGVCADLLSYWLEVYNHEHGDTLTCADITEWETHKFVKCGTAIYGYLNRPGFFRHLKPLAGCQESIARLAEHVDLVIVTSSPKEAYADKVEWVREYLPMIPKNNIIATYRKDLVHGHFLIDDYPRNLENTFATPILMDAPYNQEYTLACRVRTWDEIERLIMEYVNGVWKR